MIMIADVEKIEPWSLMNHDHEWSEMIADHD